MVVRHCKSGVKLTTECSCHATRELRLSRVKQALGESQNERKDREGEIQNREREREREVKRGE